MLTLFLSLAYKQIHSHRHTRWKDKTHKSMQVLILDFFVVDSFFYGCLGVAHLLITVKICGLIKRQNVVNIKHFSNNLTEF